MTAFHHELYELHLQRTCCMRISHFEVPRPLSIPEGGGFYPGQGKSKHLLIFEARGIHLFSKPTDQHARLTSNSSSEAETS